MPYIDAKLTGAVTPAQREVLKNELGRAIALMNKLTKGKVREKQQNKCMGCPGSSFCSQSAVRSGERISSGITVTREMPLCVGTRYFVFRLPLRSTKPILTSFSIMPARVAGVPSPFRSASSGVSFAPARSIADRSVPSVYLDFGFVMPS